MLGVWQTAPVVGPHRTLVTPPTHTYIGTIPTPIHAHTQRRYRTLKIFANAVVEYDQRTTFSSYEGTLPSEALLLT